MTLIRKATLPLCRLFLLSVVALCTSPHVSVAVGAPVLLIVDEDDPNDGPGNDSVVERLEILGHDVTTINDDLAMSTDPSGSDLIVISSSTSSSNVLGHFTQEAIPIIQWEQAMWDDLLISNASGRDNAVGSAVEVVDISHPLAGFMGFTELGEFEVRDSPTGFHMGSVNNLAPEAVVIAEEQGGGDPSIVVVDEGGELNNGSSAPAIRIMLFYGDESLDGVNDLGLQIFDASVNYALGIDAANRLQAGDANQDLEFNFDDILQVLATNKFETGQPATWGEGDWDGAPGGSLGNPPAGDGLFDFNDILAGLANGLFEMGPYAANQPAVGQAVPEPSSIVLLSLGVVAFVACRYRGITVR